MYIAMKRKAKILLVRHGSGAGWAGRNLVAGVI